MRHPAEPRIRGHVVVCFLAFLVRSVLERRLFEETGMEASSQRSWTASPRCNRWRWT